ncbi:MAG: 30S ribosome-binding factor RbfA [Candidatus Oleimicrobiaceae bacterium]
MHPSFKRSQRVGELVKRELSAIIFRQVKDPGVGEMTITEVAVSDDLRFAKVYVTTANDPEARETTMRALQRAAGFLRSQLGARIKMRYTPELRFFYDDTLDRADRIETLLRNTGGGSAEQ